MVPVNLYGGAGEKPFQPLNEIIGDGSPILMSNGCSMTPEVWLKSPGIYDLTWRWNRNASGFPLVVKGPYQLQIGFEVSSTNGIHRIRFPNGEMQTFRLQNTGLAQWHTNVQAQEEKFADQV